MFLITSGQQCDLMRQQCKTGKIWKDGKCVDPPVRSMNIWGLYDDSSNFTDIINGYESYYNSTHTDNRLTINYYKKVYNKVVGDYDQDLTEAFAKGEQPDVFMINNKWLPKNLKAKRLLAAPLNIFTPASYNQAFVDVASDDFVADGQVYAVPLYVDTLALFYNVDILKNAGIIDSFGFVKPPTDWEEFKDDVEKLSIIDKEGNIKRAGVSMGTAQNVNRAADIFASLVLQSGSKLTDDNKTQVIFATPQTKLSNMAPGESALQFYTDFADPAKRIYTWNKNMSYSIDAFYQEDAAMMLSYAYNIPTIKAKNEKLNFAVAKLPQIKGSEFKATMSNYWGFVVSAGTPNTDVAWDFLQYLSQKDNLAKYLGKTGRPTPRRDMMTEQKDDPVLGPFVEQLIYAKSWYQPDDVASEAIINTMIDSVSEDGNTIKNALQKAADDMNYLFWRFKNK